MTRAVLSIGSNVGDPQANLDGAVERFAAWRVAVSPTYVTPPWGGVEQQDFHNAVLIVEDPSAQASDWLRRAQAAEAAAGRVREVRWGPRTLDVDVIAVDDIRSADPALTLPHPRATERAFVLVPWLAADPSARLDGVALGELIAKLDPAEVAAVRLVGSR